MTHGIVSRDHAFRCKYNDRYTWLSGLKRYIFGQLWLQFSTFSRGPLTHMIRMCIATKTVR